MNTRTERDTMGDVAVPATARQAQARRACGGECKHQRSVFIAQVRIAFPLSDVENVYDPFNDQLHAVKGVPVCPGSSIPTEIVQTPAAELAFRGSQR